MSFRKVKSVFVRAYARYVAASFNMLNFSRIENVY